MRGRLTAPLVVAAALAVLAPASAAAAELRLTPVGHPRFPDRSFVLTLPSGQTVKPQQVRVTENGGPVSAPSVSATTAAPSDFGIVLVLDTSKSMTGRPIHDAFAAARALAKRRQPDQPLGVVTFDSTTRVLLPLTTDAGDIDRALAEPPRLRPETHIYDGTAAGVSLLAHKKMAAGTVVVLSDGGDTGSRVSLPGAAARARKAGVRVFTVGLETGSFDPEALGQLAEGAGGTYTQASQSSELAQIYDQLGVDLSKELLVQYASLQGPKRRVEVEARVDGVGTATASYRSPAMHIEAAPPYAKRDFWSSPAALFLVSMMAGTLLVIGLSAVLARPERKRLRQRMAMFVSAPQKRNSDETGEHGAADKVLLATERGLRLSEIQSKHLQKLIERWQVDSLDASTIRNTLMPICAAASSASATRGTRSRARSTRSRAPGCASPRSRRGSRRSSPSTSSGSSGRAASRSAAPRNARSHRRPSTPARAAPGST